TAIAARSRPSSSVASPLARASASSPVAWRSRARASAPPEDSVQRGGRLGEELLLEAAADLVLLAVHGLDRDRHLVGHLFGAQAVDEVEAHEGAILGAQSLDHAPEDLPLLLLRELIEGRGRLRAHELGLADLRAHRLARHRAQVVPRGVRREGADPRAELVPLLRLEGAEPAHVVRRQVHHELPVDLLDVVRPDGVPEAARDLVDAAVDEAIEAPVELAPRLRVALEHSPEQLLIGEVFGAQAEL